MAKLKSRFQVTLGKREIVKNMISQKMTLAQICLAAGCTRADPDEYYGDLLEKHCPLEYVPSEEDRLMVWRSVAYGMSQADICLRLGVADTTLRKHYAH